MTAGTVLILFSLADPPDKKLGSDVLEGGSILIKIKPKIIKSQVTKKSNKPEKSINDPEIDKLLKAFPDTTITPVVPNADLDSEMAGWYIIRPPENPGQIQIQEIPEKDQQANEKVKKVKQKVSKYSLGELKKAFKASSAVDTVEDNAIVESAVVPNDPYYSSANSWGQGISDMWGLKKINVETAWNRVNNTPNIVVADVDSGVDLTHPDIVDNIWVNPREIPNDGLDNDNNGYIDDYHGWNWVSNNNNTMDDNGHGTHTAGTIAAKGGNGIGITGVTWNSRLMPLKFLSAGGYGTLSGGASAIVYAANMGAKVTSNSWGCNCTSKVTDDALNYARKKGVINVVAAGNSNEDVLTAQTSPADSDAAITVGATDSNDLKASFSNYGPKIDVTAPGKDILSLKATGGHVCYAEEIVGVNYCRLSGTSMATPHVAGLAALALKIVPTMTMEQFRQQLHAQSTDLGSAGFDNTYGYGRINAATTIYNLSSTNIPPQVFIASPSSRTGVTSSTKFYVIGVADGPNFASYKVELGYGNSPSSWQQIYTSTTPVPTQSVLASYDPNQLNDGDYTVKLTVTTTSGKNFESKVFGINVNYFGTYINSPQQAVANGPQNIVGTVAAYNGKILKNYTIDYGVGSNPTSYSNVGVTLTNNGTMQVTNGVLGQIDVNQLTDGLRYKVRLTATATNGTTDVTYVNLVVDKSLVSGWPKVNSNWPCWGYKCETKPIVANIDDDSDLEVVTGNQPNQLIAYNRDGSIVPGWPFKAGATEFFRNAPIAADLTGDGKPEILAVASKIGDIGGNIYIIQRDGTSLPGWSPVNLGTCTVERSSEDPSPAIGDLNSDGKPEIVYLENQCNIYKPLILHAKSITGTELTGFPKEVPQPVNQNYSGSMTPTTLTDINKDGKLEILSHLDNYLYLFSNAGELLPGWPKISSDNGFTDHAVADLNGNGQLSIIARGVRKYTSNETASVNLYAWDIAGNSLTGWPQNSDNAVWNIPNADTSLSTFDLDGDGKDEVVYQNDTTVSLHGIGGKRSLPLFAVNTVSHGSTPIPLDLKIYSAFSRDECNGVYIAQKVYDKTGNQIWTSANYERYTAGWDPYEGCFKEQVSSDLNNDGKLELLASKIPEDPHNGDPEFANAIYMWVIPTGSYTYPSDHWSMNRHDAQNTRRYKSGQKNSGEILTIQPAPRLPIYGVLCNKLDNRNSLVYYYSLTGKPCAGNGTFMYNSTGDLSNYNKACKFADDRYGYGAYSATLYCPQGSTYVGG